jgi:small nuclear ribonucleoprotein (snRNP)-like protein
MSAALKKELVGATGVKEKRNEDEQDFLGRLVTGVANLDDSGWEELSPEAQDWYNDAAGAANKNKPIASFGDEELEAAPPARSTRGAKKDVPAAQDDDDAADPEVGDKVLVTSKRGKEISGEVVEIDDDVIVVSDADGEEHELDRDKQASVEVIKEPAKPAARGSKKDVRAAKEEAECDDDISVDDRVTAVTKRGKEISGKVVEIDGDILVIETDPDGEEQELNISNLKSLVKQEAKEPARAARGTRRTADRDAEAAPDKKARPTKVSKEDNGGVSVTTRIRELILDDLEATPEAIGKLLAKEKLAFKDNTLKLIHSEVHRLVDMMKARKMLKVAR